MTFAEVAAYLKTMAGVTVGTKWGNKTWMVGDRGFAWERPLSKADLERYGDEPPPTGEILAVRVANLDAKDALLAIAPPGFFTIPHFNGYAAVLIVLKQARAKDVRAVLLDAHTSATAAKPKRAPAKRKRPARRGKKQA